MPQAAQQSGDSQQDAMMNSMKTMNMVMPLMSAVFCFTFPVGLGIYWVASAAVRSVQQVVINKKMDKIQIEDLISENMKKMERSVRKRDFHLRRLQIRPIRAPRISIRLKKAAAIQMLRQEPRRLKKLTKTLRMQNLAALLQRPIW